MKSIDGFAVGIIDNDKRQIKYLDEFEIVDELKKSLLLWKHKNKRQFIIQICPALEKCRWKDGEEESMDITEIGLIHELDEIKRYTKSVSSIEDAKLKLLFKAIGNNSQNPSVKKLKGWITILKEKNDQVDINDLKNVWGSII